MWSNACTHIKLFTIAKITFYYICCVHYTLITAVSSTWKTQNFRIFYIRLINRLAKLNSFRPEIVHVIFIFNFGIMTIHNKNWTKLIIFASRPIGHNTYFVDMLSIDSMKFQLITIYWRHHCYYYSKLKESQRIEQRVIWF